VGPQEVITVVALGVALDVRDRPGVLAGQDQRRVQGQVAPEGRQTASEARAQEQCRALHGTAAHHDHLGPDPVLSRLPCRRLPAVGLDDHGMALPLPQPAHGAAGHDLNSPILGGGQLHHVRPLLGAIGAPQVAQARAATPANVDGELLHPVAQPLAAVTEQHIVVVDPVLLEEVDAVLFHVLVGAATKVRRSQPRNGPTADDLLRDRQRGPRVDNRRPSVGAGRGERQRAVPGQNATRVDVELADHLQLAPGEVLPAEPRTRLQDKDARTVVAQGCELLRHGAAACAGADDDDVGLTLEHETTPARPSAERSRGGATPLPARSSP